MPGEYKTILQLVTVMSHGKGSSDIEPGILGQGANHLRRGQADHRPCHQPDGGGAEFEESSI